MFSFSRFLFFVFVVCCTCKNQVRYAGSYFFDTQDYFKDGLISAFTVTKEQATEINKSINMDKYSDFAAFRDKGQDLLLVNDDTFPYLCHPNGVVSKGYVSDENDNVYEYGDYRMVFYPYYKGEIRRRFTLTYGKSGMYADAKKVSEKFVKQYVDYEKRKPKYANYDDYYIVEYDNEKGGNVAVVVNEKEGVIDVFWKKLDGNTFLNSCYWIEKKTPEDPDKINCDAYTIEFSGDIISGDAVDDSALGTVVSCLVLIISVLVFTLL